MRITIEIDCDNAAFTDGMTGDEAALILHKLASYLRGTSVEDADEIALRDSNGNTCGKVTVTDR